MSISFKFGSFEIYANTLNELWNEWQALGGESLDEKLKVAVTTAVHGAAAGLVAEKLGGTVISTTGGDPSADSGSHPHSGQVAADIPPSEARQPQSQASSGSDPWSSTNYDSSRATTSISAPGAAGSDVVVSEDRFGNTYTIGLDSAPNCDCGAKAAKVKAKSRSGKWYTAWRCAKGLGSNYRDKCAYSEFAD